MHDLQEYHPVQFRLARQQYQAFPSITRNIAVLLYDLRLEKKQKLYSFYLNTTLSL